MARKKTPSKLASTRKRLSGRLLELRVAQYGIRGGPEMARSLDVPARSWYNYESGVTVPGEIILSVVNKYGVNPAWLLTGAGPMYIKDTDSSTQSQLEHVPTTTLENVSTDVKSRVVNAILGSLGVSVTNDMLSKVLLQISITVPVSY